MDVFFNMYKVKYSKLLDLLRENNDINIGSDDTVHIYINLETIILKMCNLETNQEISINKNAKLQFIANIINLAAHYRMFFTKHKIESKIFLYIPSLNIKKYKNTVYKILINGLYTLSSKSNFGLNLFK